MPGPGNYQNPDYKDIGKAFTMQGRNERTDINGDPGPGQYNPRLPHGPAITIGEKIPLNKNQNSNPGPGNYNATSTLETTGPKIGKGKRILPKNMNVPGPGSYNDKRKPNPYKGRWSKTNRDDKNPSKTPGPGSYNIQPMKGPEGPKILKRHPDNKDNDNPGPADYVYDTKGKSPAFTIGVKLRRKSLDDVPAPNHYIPGDTAVRNNSPR
mmetsp:Transcript_24626/g.27300  ORF Transcript_24626/g.27300 Transcript_24626/m.27300 type:complete len:210 (-) Transcript_24626:1996-2625(-)